jgi:hypothetical protein
MVNELTMRYDAFDANSDIHNTFAMNAIGVTTVERRLVVVPPP